MIFNTDSIPVVNKNSFTVERNGPKGTKMTFNEGIIDDGLAYVYPYCREILKNNFKSILVIGLGLGIIPQYIAKNIPLCTTIDSIDNNTELIDWVTQIGYLDNKINVIVGDCFTYIPTKQYDLILIDIWWDANLASERKDELITKYSIHINPGGHIYIPLLEPGI
tara:strand:+ start:82 stop:576 length:495 start_codon:yes stop_codon:yes gene_type:complete